MSNHTTADARLRTLSQDNDDNKLVWPTRRPCAGLSSEVQGVGWEGALEPPEGQMGRW
jgi:hypothetical protein